MAVQPAFFETQAIRRVYDEATETWWFSVVDIVQALTQQPDYQTARKYWNKLKERLGKEGSQSVTNCHQLKMLFASRSSTFTATSWKSRPRSKQPHDFAIRYRRLASADFCEAICRQRRHIDGNMKRI